MLVVPGHRPCHVWYTFRRHVSLFAVDPDRRRACPGAVDRMHTDPRWRNNLRFFEYFHSDNGAGLMSRTEE